MRKVLLTAALSVSLLSGCDSDGGREEVPDDPGTGTPGVFSGGGFGDDGGFGGTDNGGEFGGDGGFAPGHERSGAPHE